MCPKRSENYTALLCKELSRESVATSTPYIINKAILCQRNYDADRISEAVLKS